MSVGAVEITDATDAKLREAKEADDLKEGGDLPKISKAEFDAMALNPSTEPSRLIAYTILDTTSDGLVLRVRPDPDLVEMDEVDVALENAMSIANDIYRRRRTREFERRLRSTNMPVLVAEGDSWFQFPRQISEVIDHLSTGYNVACLSAAGDEASNMIDGPVRYGGREFLSKLLDLGNQTQAFLFSGAGNDIIGRDSESNEPALQHIIKKSDGGTKPHHFVDAVELSKRVVRLEGYYSNLISSIRTQPQLRTLPIIFHGYDYVHPFDASDPQDKRTPFWAKDGGVWLAPAFEKHGIEGQGLRREILMYLIDTLYDMLNRLSGESQKTHIWVVNCRGATTSRDDWADEIHPTGPAFFKIAQRFNETISKARTAAARDQTV